MIHEYAYIEANDHKELVAKASVMGADGWEWFHHDDVHGIPIAFMRRSSEGERVAPPDGFCRELNTTPLKWAVGGRLPGGLSCVPGDV